MKIEIKNWKDLPDGSAEVDFEFDDEFIKAYLKNTGKKRYSKKGMSDWILSLLKEAC